MFSLESTEILNIHTYHSTPMYAQVTIIVRELCCVIDVRQLYHKFKLLWAPR